MNEQITWSTGLAILISDNINYKNVTCAVSNPLRAKILNFVLITVCVIRDIGLRIELTVNSMVCLIKNIFCKKFSPSGKVIFLKIKIHPKIYI